MIFVATTPVTEKDIKESLHSSLKIKASKDEINETIQKLQKKYKHPNFSFELMGLSDGYQFMTKAAYHDLVGQYLRIQSKKKLSRAAMETLAIIAYKQPMTKSGIESIRGVNCDYAILKLVEKELIEILGRAQTPGRPILYGTSDKFMDYFGIREITDLPKLKEIIVSENSIGMEAGLEKMHNEGLTEDYQFKPDPKPINEEVDLSEVSVDIETTDELESNEKVSESIEGEDQSTEEIVSEEIVTSESEKSSAIDENNPEVISESENPSTDEAVSEELVTSEAEEASTIDENNPEVTSETENTSTEEAVSEELITSEAEEAIDTAVDSDNNIEVEENNPSDDGNMAELVTEEIDLPEIQKPVETFDIENINEEIRNEEEGEGVNSEEN